MGRNDIRKYLLQLEEFNSRQFEICSTWIDRETGDNTSSAQAQDAYLDIKEVLESDVLVAIMDDPEYAYRGTFSEIGCALGANKPIIIFCPGIVTGVISNNEKDSSKADEPSKFDKTQRVNYSHKCMTNVFYHHPSIRHVKTWDKVFDCLTQLQRSGS